MLCHAMRPTRRRLLLLHVVLLAWLASCLCLCLCLCLILLLHCPSRCQEGVPSQAAGMQR